MGGIVGESRCRTDAGHRRQTNIVLEYYLNCEIVCKLQLVDDIIMIITSDGIR